MRFAGCPYLQRLSHDHVWPPPADSIAFITAMTCGRPELAHRALGVLDAIQDIGRLHVPAYPS
jgi:hypothetical protein